MFLTFCAVVQSEYHFILVTIFWILILGAVAVVVLSVYSYIQMYLMEKRYVTKAFGHTFFSHIIRTAKYKCFSRFVM